ncbi:lysoplasmalogenase [uncultured Paraglaciecola sp.]|uniref:lysoplasmalogenase n=1 Tax=uncultured Paraglaciecola sp. TaxID=1765024 RepID=UPI0026050DD0|nr:lysoplasmalogenase [uncultured Paraglaciecola sp.]
MSKSICVAFFIFVIFYMLGLGFAVDFLWLLKVIPILILGAGVLTTKPSSTRSILLLALMFSACGDLLLAFDIFIYGVGAFLLAQLSYAFMFKSYWTGIAHRWPLSVLLIGGMVTMAWLLIPSLGDLKIPVMAYLCAIGAMGLLATQSSLPIRWSVLGAILFIISDSFIAVNKFIMPIPFEAYWIMSTYYGAQFMLVTGFLAAMKQQNE